MKDTVTFDRIALAADRSDLLANPILARAEIVSGAKRVAPHAQRRLAQGGLATVSVLALAACQGGGSTTPSSTTGTVVKGPIEGAFVFADNDNDGVFDAGTEASGISGKDGSFVLTGGEVAPDAPIVAILDGAVDTTSGRIYGAGETLTAPSGSTVISPFTTMMQDAGLTADQVGALLGLEAGEFDPTTFNPYAEGTDPTLAVVAEGRAQQVMAIVETFTAVLEAAGMDGAAAYDIVQEIVVARIGEDFEPLSAMLDQIVADLLANATVQESGGGVAAEVLSGLQSELVAALDAVVTQIGAVTDLGDGGLVPAYQLVAELIDQARAAALAEADHPGAGSVPLAEDGAAAAMVDAIAANTAPEMTDWSAQVTVSEDTATLVVLTAEATDAEDDPITYALTGADAAKFSINAETGEVAFLTQPNFEEQSSYRFTVIADDGTEATTRQVTVTVADVNEAPTFGEFSTELSVDENSSTLSLVTASASDPDAGDTLSYALSGTDAAAFTIDAATGAISLKAPADYETQSSYSLSVTVSDGEESATQALTVTVNDVNEAPTLSLTGANVSVSENLEGKHLVLTAQVADSDADDTATLSLEGADAAAFTIDATTGQVSFIASPDYEAKSTYNFTVVAQDAAGLHSAQDVTVNVTNVDPLVHLTVDTKLVATAGESYAAAMTAVDDANDAFFGAPGVDPLSAMTAMAAIDDVMNTAVENPDIAVSSGGITLTNLLSGNELAFNFSNFSPTSLADLQAVIGQFEASQDFADLTITGGFESLAVSDADGAMLASLSHTASGIELFLGGMEAGDMDTLVLNGTFGNQIADYIDIIESAALNAANPDLTYTDNAFALMSMLGEQIDMTGVSMMAGDQTLTSVSWDATDTSQSLTYTLGDHVFSISADGLPGLIDGMITAAGGAEAFFDVAMAGFYVEQNLWNWGTQPFGDVTITHTGYYEEASLFYVFSDQYYGYTDASGTYYAGVASETNVGESWTDAYGAQLPGFTNPTTYSDGWAFDGFGTPLEQAEYDALYDSLAGIVDYLSGTDGLNTLQLGIDYSIAGESVLSLDVERIVDFVMAMGDTPVLPGSEGQLVAEFDLADGTPVTELSNPGEYWAITLLGDVDLSTFAGGMLDSQANLA